MPSVYVYLNKGVRELPGFQGKPYEDGSGDKLTYNGIYLSQGKDHLRLNWDIDVVIPAELHDLVETISCYEAIPWMAPREPGIYRHETAECELMPGDHGSSKWGNLVYRLKITAKKLEDIRAILHKVKTGAIRPEESYNASQAGKTRQELESKLASIRELADELGKRSEGSIVLWLFVNRLTVAEKIINILDDNK